MQLIKTGVWGLIIYGLFISVSVASESIHVEWGYTPPIEPAVTGFKLYQEGSAVCQVDDSSATSIDCDVTLTAETTNFTLTAMFIDGTESPHSSPYAYVTTIADPLEAVIEAAPLTGTAPVVVQFSAASSTGLISEYHWEFGDGVVSSESVGSHEYTSAGTYSAKLTVIDESNASNTATTAITISEPETIPEPEVIASPPTAVISSSTAAGSAPLVVNFDGSSSTADGSTTITNYTWIFGDGNSATGATSSNSFTAAGTYLTELTVTDSNGMSDTASTPVIVSLADVNQAPTAVIAANAASGFVPFSVSLDGSSSSDSDGSIALYTWYFGDGSSGSGATVTHTYTTEATYAAVLQVTDDGGATATASTQIVVQPEETVVDLNIETGEIAVTGEWVRVHYSSTFEHPIVLAGPASFNNAEPGVICLRNVDTTGFDIKMKEWDYLDGIHPEEVVNYLVMEKGRHTLPDGSTVEAGTFTGRRKWSTVNFSEVFSKIPIVLTTVATMNENDTISGRVKNVEFSGFSYYFREQEDNLNKHADETVHFIVWEPGEGNIGMLQYQVATTADIVTDAWGAITFPSNNSAQPLILAGMQTTNDVQPSSLRIKNLSTGGVEMKVEEEQSKDSEVEHSAESVGYITILQE